MRFRWPESAWRWLCLAWRWAPVLLLKAQLGRGRLLFSLLGMGVAAVIAIQGSGVLFHDMYRKMWLKDAYSINAPGGQVRDIVENKVA